MAGLVPHPFGRLVERVLRDVEDDGPILDLPRDRVVRGPGPGRSWRATLHGQKVASPLGPAAGPHTQLAQNLVLGWLGGCRIFELKTVQIQDELEIPRPCIDMRGPGFNVEWSQELRLEESLREYVKASMLLQLIDNTGGLGLESGFGDFVFDMSVGYDLAGIRSDRIQAFLAGMRDATTIIDRLRAEIPHPWRSLRDLPFRSRISEGVTLSTFHGCPPGEIEGIASTLLEQGLHVVVKLNPTLLGPERLRALLSDQLGWPQRVPDSAFSADPTFPQAMEMVGRLRERAAELGLGFGVKLTNTLVVENDGSFLPAAERLAYLSGPPLHVLAIHLVRDVRAVFGDGLQLSFSAGIDRFNFPDAVHLGLLPVTVCSDLLRTGGYARLAPYWTELDRRMDAAGARTLTDFVGSGPLGPRTETYVRGLLRNPRYHAASQQRAPRKVGSHLVLWDCLTCDKCVPVCPNAANFLLDLPAGEIPRSWWCWENGAWREEGAPALVLEKKHQIGNFVDFCNECGNCDVFCPEDGGPYLAKPRFFGDHDAWAADSRDGFWVGRAEVCMRYDGVPSRWTSLGGERLEGPGFLILLDSDGRPIGGRADEGQRVDLGWVQVLRSVHRVVSAGRRTWVSPPVPADGARREGAEPYGRR